MTCQQRFAKHEVVQFGAEPLACKQCWTQHSQGPTRISSGCEYFGCKCIPIMTLELLTLNPRDCSKLVTDFLVTCMQGSRCRALTSSLMLRLLIFRYSPTTRLHSAEPTVTAAHELAAEFESTIWQRYQRSMWHCAQNPASCFETFSTTASRVCQK